MAALETRAIPCDLEHVDEYRENSGVAVGREGDLAFIDIYGLDNVVVLYFDVAALGCLLDDLEAVEMAIAEGGEDGSSTSGGSDL